MLPVLRFIGVHLVWSIAYFPVWWYTTGLLRLWRFVQAQLHDMIRALSLPTLAKFLFTSMYGLNDWVSRLISFPVRLVHFVILLSITIVYSIGLGVLLLAWLVFPIWIGYNLGYQLGLIPFNVYGYL